MKNHNLVEVAPRENLVVERRPVRARDGSSVAGLHNVWITLNNPGELNSYTTDMAKAIILAMREASNDRAAVAVVLTGAGDRAFCSGGNTREYAEVYAGAPAEYRQYMRLFNDMVTSILQCDKPVLCRVNGMRVGGGQEIGMACDFSISSDTAIFSQAGPLRTLERPPLLLARRPDPDRSRHQGGRPVRGQPVRRHRPRARRVRPPSHRRIQDWRCQNAGKERAGRRLDRP